MPFSAASCDQQQQHHIQILLFHTFSFYFVGYDIFYFVNLYYCSWRKQNVFFFFFQIFEVESNGGKLLPVSAQYLFISMHLFVKSQSTC